MTEALKTALDAIKEVQAKRRANWEPPAGQIFPRKGWEERESLHLTQLSTLKRQVASIEDGTYQGP